MFPYISNCVKNLTSPDLPLILSIVHQTLEALEYLHYNGIIHQDVKPDNLLLEENVVKLCDFGLCVLKNGPLKGEVVTLHYRSPGKTIIYYRITFRNKIVD